MPDLEEELEALDRTEDDDEDGDGHVDGMMRRIKLHLLASNAYFASEQRKAEGRR